jgi:hypothetical protein
MKQRISPTTAIVVLVVALGLCGAIFVGLSGNQPPATPPGSGRPIDDASEKEGLGGLRKKGTAPPAKAGDNKAAPAEKK